jgi:hypothetical protein
MVEHYTVNDRYEVKISFQQGVYSYTLKEDGKNLHSSKDFYEIKNLKLDLKDNLVYFEQKRRGELND